MKEPSGAAQEKAVEPIERIVSWVMSSGMAVSFICYATGLALLFLRHEPVPRIAQQYYHSLSGFLQAIASGEAGPFLYLGTVSLILTPFVLVLSAIIAYLRQQDRRFALIAALVLMVMITSVIVGSVFKLKI